MSRQIAGYLSFGLAYAFIAFVVAFSDPNAGHLVSPALQGQMAVAVPFSGPSQLGANAALGHYQH